MQTKRALTLMLFPALLAFCSGCKSNSAPTTPETAPAAQTSEQPATPASAGDASTTSSPNAAKTPAVVAAPGAEFGPTPVPKQTRPSTRQNSGAPK